MKPAKTPGDAGQTGHPLPASEEARHDEIPEGAEREKGLGDDSSDPVMPRGGVNPDGEAYGEGDGAG
jgi:hypothetical protein